MLYVQRSMNEAFFFFNDTATTEIYTLSLHDALPIYFEGGCSIFMVYVRKQPGDSDDAVIRKFVRKVIDAGIIPEAKRRQFYLDRKSTRLNSSHANISYAVFCLKKKKSHLLRTFHLGA